MLGFQPEEERWDGKIHRIKVFVRNRPDFSVSFRKTYLARSLSKDADAGPDAKTSEAIEAINSPLARRDIDLKLTPLYVFNAESDPVTTLLLHIDASKLNFKQVNDRYQTRLEQIGFILDWRGKIVDSFSNYFDLNFNQQKYAAALKRGLVSGRRLELTPMLYQAKLFVREEESGLVGTATAFFDIPEAKGNGLVTSSLFVTGPAVEGGKVIETPGDSGTLAQRTFRRNDHLEYSLVIYNARARNNQSHLEIRTRILKGPAVIFNGALRPVQMGEGSAPPSRIVTGGTLQLGSLAPGDYTLEVTIVDKHGEKGSNHARQEIDFSVE
jgi:hypothetical protein